MAKNGTTLGPVDLNSDVHPQERHLIAKSGTKLGLVDLSSEVPPSRGSCGQVILSWVQLT